MPQTQETKDQCHMPESGEPAEREWLEGVAQFLEKHYHLGDAKGIRNLAARQAATELKIEDVEAWIDSRDWAGARDTNNVLARACRRVVMQFASEINSGQIPLQPVPTVAAPKIRSPETMRTGEGFENMNALRCPECGFEIAESRRCSCGKAWMQPNDTVAAPASDASEGVLSLLSEYELGAVKEFSEQNSISVERGASQLLNLGLLHYLVAMQKDQQPAAIRTTVPAVNLADRQAVADLITRSTITNPFKLTVPASRPERCPTCDSPDPARHPAMQFEGEVQPCKNAWHGPSAAFRAAADVEAETPISAGVPCSYAVTDAYQHERDGQAVADAMGRYRGTEPLLDAVKRLTDDYHRVSRQLDRIRVLALETERLTKPKATPALEPASKSLQECEGQELTDRARNVETQCRMNEVYTRSGYRGFPVQTWDADGNEIQRGASAARAAEALVRFIEGFSHGGGCPCNFGCAARRCTCYRKTGLQLVENYRASLAAL